MILTVKIARGQEACTKEGVFPIEFIMLITIVLTHFNANTVDQQSVYVESIKVYN